MSKNAEQMPNGIYENLVTASLQHALAHRADVVFTGENENDLAVIRGAAEIHMLSAIKQSIQKATSPEEIATTVSKVLQAVNMEDLPASPARALLSVGDFNNAPALRKRPYTSLLRQALITNDAANPNLAAELSREFATADAVDILISFVMSSGIHVLRPALHDLATRKVPIRVVTTSYIGATETKAIRMLIEEFGAQVRVDLDGDSQRLHAKAWIIHRNTNLSTAFVGSSNISSPAMLNGREWNIRLSQKADSTLFNKLSATFETYWNSPSFHALSNDEDFVQLERALARYKHNANTNNIPLFNLEPKPHQMRMLEELAIARDVYDRHWNLVVAATGTGKTVLAALDYARACKESKRRPRLLFVAHRREILNQARHTFRNALADGSFGELWTGTDKPESNQHLFANIQTINNELKNKPDALATFEWVVVDEFHHAAAATYRTMMNSLEPVELVGLTATPERTDQIAVQDEFFDGVITSELRIWDALDLDLLSPFTYFGIGDSTDISK
ncbi:MAG: hypothetical protein RIS43_935, partial [Actinomycetota bacterium]